MISTFETKRLRVELKHDGLDFPQVEWSISSKNHPEKKIRTTTHGLRNTRDTIMAILRSGFFGKDGEVLASRLLAVGDVTRQDQARKEQE